MFVKDGHGTGAVADREPSSSLYRRELTNTGNAAGVGSSPDQPCDGSSESDDFPLCLSPLAGEEVRKLSMHESLEVFQLSNVGKLNIDYRWNECRSRLSAHECQVPAPTYQNLESRTANSDFWNNEIKDYQCLRAGAYVSKSRLTHQLLGRLKSTIPNLQIYLPKRQILRSWGWGLTIHAG
jgi:hypothetical protein